MADIKNSAPFARWNLRMADIGDVLSARFGHSNNSFADCFHFGLRIPRNVARDSIRCGLSPRSDR